MKRGVFSYQIACLEQGECLSIQMLQLHNQSIVNDMPMGIHENDMKLERQHKLLTVAKSKEGHKFNMTEKPGDHHQLSIMEMSEQQHKLGTAETLE